MSEVDIIVPVKNEAKNVDETARRINAAMKKAGIEYKIIFVDDRSTDSTAIEILNAKQKYPIILYKKQGLPGKAYSILEGFTKTTAPFVVMIDGDLQYPPEAIPDMYTKAQESGVGVVVANRSKKKNSKIRQLASKVNSFIFGRFLLGFNCDTQSGLKLIRREIFEHLDATLVKPWAFDMPLLYTARELGWKIECLDITFEERKEEQSKVNFFKTSKEIISVALKLKLARRKIYAIKPNKADTMIGAGVAQRGKRFITHTTLHHSKSALNTLVVWQKVVMIALVSLLVYGLTRSPLKTVEIVIAILSIIYFLDVIFNLFLILKSLHFPPEIVISDEQIAALDDKNLPVYSILCPLYQEASVLPAFVESINKLDWPKNKLDVLLLLEENDHETIEAAESLNLPADFRIVVVPHSFPKTKPKACNYGLSIARGEYIVIYDAEDEPETFQLKKAYLGFQKVSHKVFCLQAKLNYYNPNHNLLTRLFTAEYSLWFDVILPGLQSIEATIPLGGTSNHFRTADLKSLQGWDPFNVTEDCDLGVRLFKAGYKTAIIDSTTLEEANSNLRNWVRQRSRWIKGYIQTYFVHMRNPLTFVREQGIQAFIFQLVVGGKIAFMIINPILWVATFSYFAFYAIVGPTIEALYPPHIFYMAVTSLVFGNFMFFYYYMIGSAKRGHWGIIKYVFLIPFYWLAVSYAALIAIRQLIFNPHYWEKTHHGLHLKKLKAMEELEFAKDIKKSPFSKITDLIPAGAFAGGLLVVATIINNFFNFLYNAYLGRVTTAEQFGTISLIGSLLYLVQVPTSGISRTVTYKSAYLAGKFETPVKSYWSSIRKRVVLISLIISLVWMSITPFLINIFHSASPIPFILFTPIWLIAFVGSVDGGFLSGNLFFALIGITSILEAVGKFLFTYLFVKVGKPDLVYAAIPLSMGLSFVISYLFILRVKTHEKDKEIHKIHLSFPKKFFTTAILTKIAYIGFLSLDVILAKAFLPPTEAGQYALLSLVGKMIYFLGSLFSQFITPLVSKAEGEGKASETVFRRLMLLTSMASFAGFMAFGVFGQFTVPIMFGSKAIEILPLLPVYSAAMVFFTVAINIVSYHQIKNHHIFPIMSVLVSAAEVLAIAKIHTNLGIFTGVMVVVSVVYLAITVILHVLYGPIVILLKNFVDFLGLFGTIPENRKSLQNGKLRILILNWRDTKHIWAGGAETYMHEISKRWVKCGNHVTMFAGNDGKHDRYEVVDGVKIIRRGGFYTVYLWAMLYYLLRLRGHFDVVIDNENGIPFFTPLYVRKPKFLLIHHVHQEVFREHLKFPFSIVAMFIEKRLMPKIYKGSRIVTVSQSSKKDIIKLGCSQRSKIEIVSPGIDVSLYRETRKSKNPTFIYLGRLKPYKNIDVAIKAFSIVASKYKDAKLYIVGEGDSGQALKKLAEKLVISERVVFTGKVTDEEKVRLLGQSWVALQPSSFEGWGITVIEANACGTPVIASNTNGLRDSVVDGETGLLVPVKDINIFAKAMHELITDIKYRKLLSRDAYFWAQRFGWDQSSNQFYKILHEHVGKKVHRFSLKTI